jgi:ribosome-associated protein YbcJ (S4-like RNA binding protein)
MNFRLNKYDDEITLEAFLKAVAADDDYQQIRFMIKDGKIWVNGEKEYGRRRMLRAGDSVAFADKYYMILPHRDEKERAPQKREEPKQELLYDRERKTEKVFHHKGPLSWSEKKIKKKKKTE